MNLTESIGELEKLKLTKYEIVQKLKEKGYSDSVIAEGVDSFPFQKKWNGSLVGLGFIAIAVLFFALTFDQSEVAIKMNYHKIMYEVKDIIIPTLCLSFLLVGIFMLIDKSNIQKSVINTLKIFLIICIAASIVTFSFYAILLCMIPYIGFILWDVPQKPSEGDGAYLVKASQESLPPFTVLNNLGLKPWNGTAQSLWMIPCFFLFMGIQLTDTAAEYQQFGALNFVFYGLNMAIILLLAPLSVLLYTHIARYRYLIFLVVLLSVVYLILLFFTVGVKPGMIPPVVTIVVLGKLIEDEKLYRYTTPA